MTMVNQVGGKTRFMFMIMMTTWMTTMLLMIMFFFMMMRMTWTMMMIILIGTRTIVYDNGWWFDKIYATFSPSSTMKALWPGPDFSCFPTTMMMISIYKLQEALTFLPLSV